MSKIDEVIESISLPITIPKEAVMQVRNTPRILDIELFVKQLPAELRAFMIIDATALQSKQDDKYFYYFLLTDGYYLEIALAGLSIVAIKRLAAPGK
ncbi:MAG: hypothetical protein AB1489_37670 [Acidobacteriota bacterium]